MRNVSSTSCTSGDAFRSAGISGRRPDSSRSRNSTRAASSQSAYAPSPSAEVIALSASVCRAESWRMSMPRQRDAEAGDAPQQVGQPAAGDQPVTGLLERAVAERERAPIRLGGIHDRRLRLARWTLSVRSEASSQSRVARMRVRTPRSSSR